MKEDTKDLCDFTHWCGNCQIRIYILRHYGTDLNWHSCPYVCEYGSACRNAIETYNYNKEGNDKNENA